MEDKQNACELNDNKRKLTFIKTTHFKKMCYNTKERKKKQENSVCIKRHMDLTEEDKRSITRLGESWKKKL